jgi:hypothetical protein
MSDIAQLMRAANPVRDPAAALTGDEIDALLLLTQTRSGTMNVKQVETPGGQEKKRYRGWLVATAAFAAVVVVGIGIGLVANTGSGSNPDAVETPTTTTVTPTTEAAAPTTTQPATTTTAPPFTADQALAVNDANFAAYESGDVDAMLALFAPDVYLLDNETTREDWEQLCVWKVAEGTVLMARNCIARVSEPEGGVVVACGYQQQEYLSRAVGGNVVLHSMSMIVTPNGITRLTDEFSGPNFSEVGVPFIRWMEDHHPEDVPRVEFGAWTTVEEARENGLLTAQFADEWAAYLQANNCTYLDSC